MYKRISILLLSISFFIAGLILWLLPTKTSTQAQGQSYSETYEPVFERAYRENKCVDAVGEVTYAEYDDNKYPNYWSTPVCKGVPFDWWNYPPKEANTNKVYAPSTVIGWEVTGKVSNLQFNETWGPRAGLFVFKKRELAGATYRADHTHYYFLGEGILRNNYIYYRIYVGPEADNGWCNLVSRCILELRYGELPNYQDSIWQRGLTQIELLPQIYAELQPGIPEFGWYVSGTISSTP